MTYPVIESALKTSTDFANMDQRIRSARSITARIRAQSESADTVRTELLDLRARLTACANAVTAYADYGATGLDIARRELRMPTLQASDVTIIGTHAQALADWIQNAIPDGSAGTTYNQVTGQYEPATFTSAQMANFRTNADIFLANFT